MRPAGGKREAESAAPFVPASRSLRTLAGAVDQCRGCPLWADATQAVFGRGPRQAELMPVGEQPGDQEARAGEPFVGPAGRELRAALELAGIAPGDAYLTNAVKHFKWRPRGKRRLHQTPRAGEIASWAGPGSGPISRRCDRSRFWRWAEGAGVRVNPGTAAHQSRAAFQ